MRRTLLAFALMLSAGTAAAQSDLQFDIDFSSQAAPVATWSTTPDASCTATGDWSGDKGASGSETLPAITGSFSYGLSCEFPGDSLAEVSWVHPTENTDGTAYENPQDVLVFASSSMTAAELEASTCDEMLASGARSATRQPDETMHTFTALDPGTWNFVAFARNTMGLCSMASNTAAKEIVGTVTVTDSISGSVPGAISGLEAS